MNERAIQYGEKVVSQCEYSKHRAYSLYYYLLFSIQTMVNQLLACPVYHVIKMFFKIVLIKREQVWLFSFYRVIKIKSDSV